ncbi:hypothetical protein F5Y11DRAFT_310560 [Daldinia sp. FL1419]|nr:hypothetical protein F5Y11DRAFT_310560 [Daldinia sp. FL1419]
MASDALPAPSQPPLSGFTCFPLLPTELRFKIWRDTFFPRVVEMHSQKDGIDGGSQPKWVSNSDNPAVMSVCSESRILAMEHFTVLLPVFKPQPGIPVPRHLYFSPTTDLLAFLGEVDYTRLSYIFWQVQQQDPTHRGLRRVAVTMNCWTRTFKHTNIMVWGNALFELEDLVLIMYDEQRPPASFRHGEVKLEKAGMDAFARVLGERLKDTSNLKELQVLNLTFNPSPTPHRGIHSAAASSG